MGITHNSIIQLKEELARKALRDHKHIDKLVKGIGTEIVKKTKKKYQ
ncbi:MAG: hypothetical protein WCF23_11565 [Candidatus Nitrosopolaris sp.]